MDNEGKYMENRSRPTPIYTARDDNSFGSYHNDQGYVNERYQQLIGDFMKCTTFYLNDFASAQHLEKQLKRLDLDTVCAYEIYQMKKEFTQTNVLDLSNFYNKQ